MEAPLYGGLWFDRLVDALEDELNGILPEVFTQRVNGGLYLVRAQSECTIEPQQPDSAERHLAPARSAGISRRRDDQPRRRLRADRRPGRLLLRCAARDDVDLPAPHAARRKLPKRGRRRRTAYDGRTGSWAVEKSSAAFFYRKERDRNGGGR